MTFSVDDFIGQLQGLLPPGPAWDAEQGVVLGQLLEAWAMEFARIQGDIERLANEADPRFTFDLLGDYERLFGLPTDCMVGIDQTLEQRRNAVVSQMASVGGQSRAYFISLAAAAGYTITITELTPHTVLSAVNYPLYGQDWRYAWQVTGAGALVVDYKKVNGGVNEPLATWGNNLITCLFNRFKPAHTVVIFA